MKEIYKYHKDFINHLSAIIHFGTTPWDFLKNIIQRKKNISWCRYVEPFNIISRKPKVNKLFKCLLPGYPDLMIRTLEEYRISLNKAISSKKLIIPATAHTTLFSTIIIATKYVKSSISLVGCELSSNYSINIPSELVHRSSFYFDDKNYCPISDIYAYTTKIVESQKKLFINYSIKSPIKNDNYLKDI